MKLGLVFNSLALVIAGLLGLVIFYTERSVPRDILDSIGLDLPPSNRLLLFSISSTLGGIFGLLSSSFEPPLLGILSFAWSVIGSSSVLWMAASLEMRAPFVIAITAALVLTSLEVFLSAYRSIELLVIKSRWRG